MTSEKVNGIQALIETFFFLSFFFFFKIILEFLVSMKLISVNPEGQIGVRVK